MKNNKIQVLTILAFPVVLTIGILLIPVVANYNDHHLAESAVAQVARWYSGHIISAVGFSLSILAVGAIDRYAQERSRPLPGLTMPFIAIGAGLYAAGLGADGIGPLAVQSAGYSPILFFDGSSFWVTGVFILGTILFGLGLLNLVIGSIRGELLTGWSRVICFVSALIFMIAPAIPSGWVLYGIAVAAFGVFVPFAVVVWRGNQPANLNFEDIDHGTM